MSSFRQGDIIWMDFSPQSGHEQSGRRPAIVISNSAFNAASSLVMVCPITNTKSRLALRPLLPGGVKTTGCVLCDHARFVDARARNAEFFETAPPELLNAVLNILSVLIAPDKN